MATEVHFPTASWTRRMVAILIDWFASTFVVAGVVGWGNYIDVGGSYQWWVLLVFIVETAVFTSLLGGSFGKLLVRLRLVRANGDARPINLLGSFARQLMVALVIPPLVFRHDGRGLHDMWTRTATVDLATWRKLAGRD